MKGSKGKSPSIQWYFKDWLSDKKLARARASSRGVWFDLLMYMADCPLHDPNCEDGILSDMSIRDIMALGRCTEDEAWHFIEDAIKLQFCDIESDKNVTFHVKSRRLSRDIDQRRKWRERQRKKREKDKEKKGVTAPVTDLSNQNHALSPTPTPISSTNNIHSTDTKHSASDNADIFYLTRKKRKLKGKRLDTFNQFWKAFNYKKGKAEAADAWIDIPTLNNGLVEKIIRAAKLEAQQRPNLIKNGRIPKFAQGWISGKRWEDEIEIDEEERKAQEWINQSGEKVS